MLKRFTRLRPSHTSMLWKTQLRAWTSCCKAPVEQVIASQNSHNFTNNTAMEEARVRYWDEHGSGATPTGAGHRYESNKASGKSRVHYGNQYRGKACLTMTMQTGISGRIVNQRHGHESLQVVALTAVLDPPFCKCSLVVGSIPQYGALHTTTATTLDCSMTQQVESFPLFTRGSTVHD